MRGRDWIGVLGLLACLVIVMGLNASTRELSEANRRFFDGRIGEPVGSPYHDVTVHDARLADAVEWRGSVELADEGKVFVVVDWSVAGGRREQAVSGVLITARGATHLPRTVGAQAAITAIRPGYTATGQQVFQVADDETDGLAFVVEAPERERAHYQGVVRVRPLVPDGATPVGLVPLTASAIEVSR